MKKILAAVALLVLLAFPFIIYFNAQALTDWWQLRGYIPPAYVVGLAKQDSMTTYATHAFYVNHPNVESDASQFRKDCGQSEKTIILGCYHSNQDGIFIYNVKDSRLMGIQQVTAAHEMLHATYDRLSKSDKARVDKLLEDFYSNGLTDQRIKDTIDTYKQTEPNDLVNEMHSIFGTEVSNLPPQLESYYTRYFTNRKVIADFANSYESEFTSREDQIKADDDKLSQMKSQIDSEEQSLQDQRTKIEQDKARLDSLRGSGRISEYNAGVSSFNEEVYTYNSGVGKVRSEIDEFNQLVDERNAIAGDLASLNQAIDSRQVPQTFQ